MDRETSVKKLLRDLSRQFIQEQGLSGRIGVKAEDISRHLGIHRSNASHYLNRLVKNGKAIKINGRPVYFLDREETEEELNRQLDRSELIVNDVKELTAPMHIQKRQAISADSKQLPFDSLIGHNNSLVKQIEQARQP